MQKTNSAILHHLYSLLIELNLTRPDESVWEEKKYSDDPFITSNLRKIRLLTAQFKAQREKSKFQQVLAEIRRLKDLGADKLQQLLNPQEMAQLQPLFSKFEDLTAEDEASIAEDQQLLQLLAALKNKLDDPGHEQ